MAVGDEGAHAELCRELERVSVVRLGITRHRANATRGNRARETMDPRLVASSAVRSRTVARRHECTSSSSR